MDQGKTIVNLFNMFMKKIVLIICSFFFFSNVFSQSSFNPQPGEKYLVSAWVKEVHDTQQVKYEHSNITIRFLAGNGSVGNALFILEPSGSIIEGWQRIIGIVTVPEEATTYSIVLNETDDYDTYFDDIRFFPFNGNLKSFVYDRDNKRLLAELDENNYATFYEYDKEGGLVRVKKETEKGIYTIQETRSSTKKTIN